MKKSYKFTRIGSFSAIFMQAITANLTPILFVPIMDIYGLGFEHLGLLVLINFGAQVLADVLFAGIIDKVGYKKIVFPATILTFLGLLFFAVTPYIFGDEIFIGMVIATVISASAAGILEISLSPLISSINSDTKSSSMGLLHSFYSWGIIAVILISTALLYFIGKDNWNYIVFFWLISPVVTFVLYSFSKFPKTECVEGHTKFSKKVLLSKYMVVALIAIFCGGGSELAMNQFVSGFMERGLLLPKIYGDIFGAAGFAVMMVIGRIIYGKYGEKINLSKVLIATSFMAFVTYLFAGFLQNEIFVIISCALTGFAISFMWPGTVVLASSRFVKSGAWIFAVLAISGDFGAGISSYVMGFLIDFGGNIGAVESIESFYQVSTAQASMKFALIVMSILPLISALCHISLYKMDKKLKMNIEG